MTEVISVRFRNGCKEYYFDPKGLTVPTDTDVIVETAQGPEFARCSQGNHQVEDNAVVKPLRGLIRIATDNDRHTAAYNRGREKEAFEVCKKKIQQHKLEMKLVRVECSFDGSKILFFFTADGRVDFRELVKDLAGVFRARIELRQIGVRDEAKMIGGLGICGRPFCCSQFMDEFLPVSIKMAKTQSLSLNPTKISGTCGRLMCCLKYEQDAYEDAIKRMPKNDSFVLTPDGTGNVSDINVLKETVNVRLDDRPEGARCYHNCEVCVLRNGKGSRDGIDVAAEIKARYPETKVIIITSMVEESYLKRAKAAGAESFWYKDVSPESLLEVMDRTMAGESLYPDRTPETRLGQVSSTQLTPREIEVLRLVCEGLEYEEIAAELGISSRTVKRFVSSLLEKTGYSNRTRLAIAVTKKNFILPHLEE